MSYPYLIQGSNITVVIGNKPHTISKSHITYQKVLSAIKASDWDLVKNIIEPIKVVLNFGAGNVSVQGETFYWKGKEMHNALTSRMIAMLQDEFPIGPMVNFMENLMNNPSKRAVTELYGFLEKNNLPITPDGYFLAYKRVRDDYMDVHSGTMDNSVGNVVFMERNDVDDNKDNTCSTGLHFCSESYLKSFSGSRVIIVKINPRDVVSIPTDYNNAKGRACRYEVIGEVGNDPESALKAFDKAVQANASNNIAPPVAAPQMGTSAFYQGYTDGFTDQGFNTQMRSNRAYTDGYYKGYDDAEHGSERYRFVKSSPTFTRSPNWPMPSKG